LANGKQNVAIHSDGGKRQKQHPQRVVIKVKLTINGRFTVDISHDRLVMRFSRIKDSGMEWFLSAKGVQPNGLQQS